MKTFDFENFKNLVDEFVNEVSNNHEKLEAILDKTENASTTEFYHQCDEMNKLSQYSNSLSHLAGITILCIEHSQIKAQKLMKKVSETIEKKMNQIRKEENDIKE